MATAGWPDDWQQRKEGYSEVGLARRSLLPGYCIVVWKHGHVADAPTDTGELRRRAESIRVALSG